MPHRVRHLSPLVAAACVPSWCALHHAVLRLTGTRCTNPTQVRNRGTEAAALVTAALAHAAADLGVSQCGVIEELLPDGGAPPRSREIDPRLSRD